MFHPSLFVPCLKGNRDEARFIFEKALAIQKEKLGEGHEDTMKTSASLKVLDKVEPAFRGVG